MPAPYPAEGQMDTVEPNAIKFSKLDTTAINDNRNNTDMKMNNNDNESFQMINLNIDEPKI